MIFYGGDHHNMVLLEGIMDKIVNVTHQDFFEFVILMSHITCDEKLRSISN